jgi:SAM-dependent methyltransferase
MDLELRGARSWGASAPAGATERLPAPDREPAPRDGRAVRLDRARGDALDPLDQLLAWARPPEGAHVLEIHCGDGALAALLAAGGALVTAVDTRPELVARARRRIARDRLDDRVTAQVMPTHTLDFPDNHFDLVVGREGLDRADLDACRRELHRVLRPGGLGVFAEPVTSSPAPRAPKRGAPAPGGSGWAGERPLELRELQRFLGGFEEAECAYFQLAGPLDGLWPPLRGPLARWERRLLGWFPSMRRLARACVIRVQKAGPTGVSTGLASWG